MKIGRLIAILGTVCFFLGFVVTPVIFAAQNTNSPGNNAFIGTKIGQNTGTAKQVTDIEVTRVWVDACRVWFEVKNKGNVKIDKVLREQVWVDGTLKDDCKTHYRLAPGAIFSHGVGADPGLKIAGPNKKVKVLVDAENVLAELNKVNNSKEAFLSCKYQIGDPQIPILQPSDLIVSFDFKHVLRKDPNADGNFIWSYDIDFTVTNQGKGGSVPCKILVEKQPESSGPFSQAGPEVNVPAINPGQSVTVVQAAFGHTGSAPTYRATVDSHHAVNETKEDNNQFVKKFTY